MAVSNTTFTDIGGAASDLFAGFSAQAQGSLQAQGLQITAEGTQISAQSTELSADSLRIQAQGNLAESSEYDQAAVLAQQNEDFTKQSTAVQDMQEARTITQTIGGQKASVAGAGFSSSGSAYDLMRDSAQQGALARSTLQQQGVITEAGYAEQATSFQTMSAAGKATAAAEMTDADQTDAIAAEQNNIATQQQQLAVATQDAANNAADNDFISSAIKGVAAVASLFMGNPAPAVAAVATA